MSPFSCSRWDAHVIRRKKSRKRFESGSFLPPCLRFVSYRFMLRYLRRAHTALLRASGGLTATCDV